MKHRHNSIYFYFIYLLFWATADSAQGSVLEGFEKLYELPGIEPSSALCKASTLPALSFLQPLNIFSGLSNINTPSIFAIFINNQFSIMTFALVT